MYLIWNMSSTTRGTKHEVLLPLLLLLLLMLLMLPLVLVLVVLLTTRVEITTSDNKDTTAAGSTAGKKGKT